MYNFQEHLYQSEKIREIRTAVYQSAGYFVIKDFLPRPLVNSLRQRWLNGEVDYYFDSFYKNTQVNFDTPNYLIKGASDGDRSYCINIWNPAPDSQLQDIAIEANKIRNIVEGRPRYFATRTCDDLVLQYRLSRTVSSGFAVKKHADFFEEFRPDPAGDHSFDPKRCQLTLFLSDYGQDYSQGGFHFHNNAGEEVLFGRDVPVAAGDLVIWKYSNIHSVREVKALDQLTGFSRIIFPQFDNMAKNKRNKQREQS